MPETLSASPTTYWFYKYVPCIVGVAFLALVFRSIHGTLPASFELAVLGVGALIIALGFAYSRQFKRVGLLGTCVVISDGARETHIPVGEILRVSKTLGSNPAAILLVLRSPSPFGRRILFIPCSLAPLFSFQENPVVIRLRRLCTEQPAAQCPHNASLSSPTSR